jgi:hypothetical protein
MGPYKKLDLWSIMDGIEEVIDSYYDADERKSQYWDFYSEQINEMGILAADMLDELQQIRGRIGYKMPYKTEKGLEFYRDDGTEITHTEIAWFNTAACMLSDTNMTALLESEGIYAADEDEEKKKRIKALEKLTKAQQMWLYTEVIGFITRYLELRAAYETITAVIRELEYHQSFAINQNGVMIPDVAYLQ